eukprot:353268-Chlamydomonas_euryale.AAC.11
MAKAASVGTCIGGRTSTFGSGTVLILIIPHFRDHGVNGTGVVEACGENRNGKGRGQGVVSASAAPAGGVGHEKKFSCAC